MSLLTSDQFSAFFQEVYGISPFPWQDRLAQRACSGRWPAYIAAPTGSGKTASLDAAVFALAVQAALQPEQRTVGRRIFYIVNRRVIVDEAFERARKLALALAHPSENQPTVQRVSDALRSIGASADMPLDCVQLRGGIYRDHSWARSVVQPLVVCSTVDQVGSRLLFRGYGVSPASWPVHAALVANDSLLLLDEAHISRPFAQTLAAVQRYHALGAGEPPKANGIAPESPKTPFAFVQMTATPPAETDEQQIVKIEDTDREHPILQHRLQASKLAKMLVASKAAGKNAITELAETLASEATRILSESQPQPRSLAVLVNRVATAQEVHSKLSGKYGNENVTLLIGRMRPFDRDDATRELTAQLRTKIETKNSAQETRRQEEHIPAPQPRIVVATQCLEVGADFDFDALVSECASLDALRQRFGRLNRSGRPIAAQASIVIRADQVFEDEAKLDDPKNQDPIYSTALSRTWNWLHDIANSDKTVDFGILAMDDFVANLRKIKGETDFSALLAPTQDAPLLLPVHLDVWCQTAPQPTPQPEPAIFLHGVQRSDADIQICWRNDLGEDTSRWPDILSLCPPTALECLSVPIGQFRCWLIEEDAADTGDMLGALAPDAPEKATSLVADALIWRGPEESIELKTPNDLRRLRPGDTIIFASAMPKPFSLGYLPNAQDNVIPDQAAKAWLTSKRRQLLRLPPVLLGKLEELRRQLNNDSALAMLLDCAKSVEHDISKRNFPQILHAAAQEALQHEETPESLREALQDFAKSPMKIFRVARYPDSIGLVVQTSMEGGASPLDDSGDDSLSDAAVPVWLDKHLADVQQYTEDTIKKLPLSAWAETLTLAAGLHDLGKADERFQALLLGGNLNLAWAQKQPLAKSTKMPESQAAYECARKQATLPEHYRHEFLSVQFAEKMGAEELALHLIAAHHGHARPFAPIVLDDNPPDVAVTLSGRNIALTAVERAAYLPYRIDSGIADRFWRLTRRFGWWNLAYLETILRLADQQISAFYQQTGE